MNRACAEMWYVRCTRTVRCTVYIVHCMTYNVYVVVQSLNVLFTQKQTKCGFSDIKQFIFHK